LAWIQANLVSEYESFDTVNMYICMLMNSEEACLFAKWVLSQSLNYRKFIQARIKCNFTVHR